MLKSQKLKKKGDEWKLRKWKIDGGYDPIGNRSMDSFLKDFLTPEQAEEYEKELEKKNPKKYKEFKEWQKIREIVSDKKRG